MDGEFQIKYIEKPEQNVWRTIGQGLVNYNTRFAGESNEHRMCFVLQGVDEEIVGGLIGVTYWEWLYIDVLWVKEELRSRGYGLRLLIMAEAEAQRRGAKNAYLDTFSFQAPVFYQKNGYQIFGELQDFPAGHHRIFLKKQL